MKHFGCGDVSNGQIVAYEQCFVRRERTKDFDIQTFVPQDADLVVMPLIAHLDPLFLERFIEHVRHMHELGFGTCRCSTYAPADDKRFDRQYQSAMWLAQELDGLLEPIYWIEGVFDETAHLMLSMIDHPDVLARWIPHQQENHRDLAREPHEYVVKDITNALTGGPAVETVPGKDDLFITAITEHLMRWQRVHTKLYMTVPFLYAGRIVSMLRESGSPYVLMNPHFSDESRREITIPLIDKSRLLEQQAQRK